MLLLLLHLCHAVARAMRGLVSEPVRAFFSLWDCLGWDDWTTRFAARGKLTARAPNLEGRDGGSDAPRCLFNPGVSSEGDEAKPQGGPVLAAFWAAEAAGRKYCLHVCSVTGTKEAMEQNTTLRKNNIPARRHQWQARGCSMCDCCRGQCWPYSVAARRCLP